MDDPSLRPYIVTFNNMQIFKCWAEDSTHAIEQANNAEPDLIVMDVVPDFTLADERANIYFGVWEAARQYFKGELRTTLILWRTDEAQDIDVDEIFTNPPDFMDIVHKYSMSLRS